MNGTEGLELLFQHASEYEFDSFDKLFSELKPALPEEAFWEAYLMRAQIKLHATDATVACDLQKAALIGGTPKYPCLFDRWPVDAPNRFIVFPKTPGDLHGFLQALPQVQEELGKWYGEQGRIAVRQIACEINYFLGHIDKALAFAIEQGSAQSPSPTDTTLSLCLLFRCYLAMGLSQKAGDCMLELIRSSQANPKCMLTYTAHRGWANLTTGWSGETPRFYKTPDGEQLPVLDDRLKSIRMGAARTTPLEEPFVNYAEHSYEGAYAVRQYYMDLFHAMYWFQMGDLQQAEFYFFNLYRVASMSGLLMPIVECGRQVVPLLQHMKRVAAPHERDWIAEILAHAMQYEKSLDGYRN